MVLIAEGLISVCSFCRDKGWDVHPCPECGEVADCQECGQPLMPDTCTKCNGLGVIPAPAGEEPDECVSCGGTGLLNWCDCGDDLSNDGDCGDDLSDFGLIPLLGW